MESKATKEDAEEGKNVAALNDEGEVSLVSWRQITPQVSPDEVALHVRALVRVPQPPNIPATNKKTSSSSHETTSSPMLQKGHQGHRAAPPTDQRSWETERHGGTGDPSIKIKPGHTPHQAATVIMEHRGTPPRKPQLVPPW
jgi:hypothetical protein